LLAKPGFDFGKLSLRNQRSTGKPEFFDERRDWNERAADCSK
jgi:hypothetical protein